MSIKPNKKIAINAAINLAPQYVEFLRDLQKGNGGLGFSRDFLNLQNKFASYVVYYENESHINNSFSLFLFGEAGLKELNDELNAAPPEQQQEFMDEIANSSSEIVDSIDAAFVFPQTEMERAAAASAFEALPEDERHGAIKSATFFYGFLFSSFFNFLSLMVHGSKLTSLVPLAMAGHEESFFKAIQIDRMLLLHHPYFRERKALAQDNSEHGFLSRLSYRESTSPLKGKIQYPGLYMLFGILDAYQWLDNLRHEEILDICDSAGLDRYQNRIEDVNYVTKRLLEYRRWQKTLGLSMQ